MKKCIKCGTELRDEMAFCNKCGTKQPVAGNPTGQGAGPTGRAPGAQAAGATGRAPSWARGDVPGGGASDVQRKRTIVIVLAVVLAALIIGSIALSGSCSGKGTGTGSKSSGASSSTAQANTLEAKNFAGTCPVTIGNRTAIQSQNVIQLILQPSASSGNATPKDIKAYIVTSDLYGEGLGYYKWEYTGQSDIEVKLNADGDSVGKADVVVYSVLMSDGTKWGNQNASIDVATTYGSHTPIDVQHY